MINQVVDYRLRSVLKRLKPIPIQWDRFTEEAIYGWIERGDGKRDFIVIYYGLENSDNKLEEDTYWGFTTSSAKYSKKIFELITQHDEDEEHCDCLVFDHEAYINGTGSIMNYSKNPR